MSERNSVAKKQFVDVNGNDQSTWFPEADRLEFRFSDGTVRTVRPDDFPADMQRALFFHGAAAKLGDCYAGASKAAEKEGVDPTAWAVDKFDTLVENLMEGTWAERSGGLTSTNLLVQAVIRAAAKLGATVEAEQARQVVGSWTDEQRKALLSKETTMPEVRVAYMELQAERMAARAAAVDTSGSDFAKALGLG